MSSAYPVHPLDPATAAEYLAGRDIMAAAGLLAEPVRFAYYGLEEPPKDEVLAGHAGRPLRVRAQADRFLRPQPHPGRAAPSRPLLRWLTAFR